MSIVARSEEKLQRALAQLEVRDLFREIFLLHIFFYRHHESTLTKS